MTTRNRNRYGVAASTIRYHQAAALSLLTDRDFKYTRACYVTSLRHLLCDASTPARDIAHVVIAAAMIAPRTLKAILEGN